MSFWRENSKIVKISPKLLTFKKNPPLQEVKLRKGYAVLRHGWTQKLRNLPYYFHPLEAMITGHIASFTCVLMEKLHACEFSVLPTLKISNDFELQ